MDVDVVVIGAGAAGMMCAAEAGARGRRVLLIDHRRKIGERIRVSGGGRCNFTNRRADADAYLSQNPAFCRSALARFSARDFIAMVERHGIPYHEREHGQLFCDRSARDIVVCCGRPVMPPEFAGRHRARSMASNPSVVPHRDATRDSPCQRRMARLRAGPS